MTFTIACTTQRTPEWYAARLGRLTGSVAADMLATTKTGKEAAGRRNLRMRLVLERLTSTSQESGLSRDMQYGIDREADAFAAYEAETGIVVNRTGFLAHTDLLAGCSPDGLVVGTRAEDYEGLIELKCCKSATHYEYLKTKTIPDEYLKQAIHNLWITGAQWCDWVSFDDRFPPRLRLVIRRVWWRESEISSYALAARLFLDEVEREVADLVALDARAQFIEVGKVEDHAEVEKV